MLSRVLAACNLQLPISEHALPVAIAHPHPRPLSKGGGCENYHFQQFHRELLLVSGHGALSHAAFFCDYLPERITVGPPRETTDFGGSLESGSLQTSNYCLSRN